MKVIANPKGKASLIVDFQKLQSTSIFRGDHARAGLENFILKIVKLYAKPTVLTKKYTEANSTTLKLHFIAKVTPPSIKALFKICHKD